MPKKYSLSHYVKQKFGWTSQPEKEFQSVLDVFINDPDQCPIAFEGSPIELANAMYLEWKKRGQVHWCLFPTPLDVARDLAILLGIGDGHIVFDPGCGFGNLLHAAKDRGAEAFGCDFQPWLRPIGQSLRLDIYHGDFLDGYQPRDFNVVLTNPPFGRVGQSSDATADFLNKLADICTEDVQIGAILPHGFMDSERPKLRLEAINKFDVLHTEPLPPDTFKPLTGVATDLVVLRSLTPRREFPVAVRQNQVFASGSIVFEQSTLL